MGILWLSSVIPASFSSSLICNTHFPETWISQKFAFPFEVSFFFPFSAKKFFIFLIEPLRCDKFSFFLFSSFICQIEWRSKFLCSNSGPNPGQGQHASKTHIVFLKYFLSFSVNLGHASILAWASFIVLESKTNGRGGRERRHTYTVYRKQKIHYNGDTTTTRYP